MNPEGKVEVEDKSTLKEREEKDTELTDSDLESVSGGDAGARDQWVAPTYLGEWH